MLKSKVVLIACVAVLLISMLGGISYAWFSSRSEAAVNRSDNGTTGGIAAGWLNVKLDVDAYMMNLAGTPVPTPSAGSPPALIYPGRTVYYDNDTLTTGDLKSVFSYTLTNTSKTDVLARIDHAGINLDGDVAPGKQPVATALNSSTDTFLVTGMKVDLYKLLGSELDYSTLNGGFGSKTNASTLAAYQNLNEFYEDGPTWYYFAPGFGPSYNATITPAPAPWIYVNYDKLYDANFFDSANLYNVSAIASQYVPDRANVTVTPSPTGAPFAPNKWSDGVKYTQGAPFYCEAKEINLAGADPENLVKLTVIINPTTGAKTIDHGDYIYAYLPPNGQISYEYILEMDPAKASARQAMDNAFQFAVYKMQFSDAFNSDQTLHAWGVEPVQAAVEALFGDDGGTIWSDLTALGMLPTP